MSASPAITADLCARAVVAAAGVFRDDPVKAFSARRGILKRSLAPAARGLAMALKTPPERVADLLGCSLYRSQLDHPLHDAAQAAAKRAVESAVGPDAPAPPAADPPKDPTVTYTLIGRVALRLGEGPRSARQIATQLHVPEWEILEILQAMAAEGKVRAGAPAKPWDRIWQLVPVGGFGRPTDEARRA